MPTLLKPSLMLALVTVATGLAPIEAEASIAMQSCQGTQSRLPTRIADATDIVVATPQKIVFTDGNGERTITATYLVNKVAKGPRKTGDTVTLTTTCRLASTWSDFRGYPSNWCGRAANNTLPGFNGEQASTTEGALLVHDGHLVPNNGYTPCPAFAPVKLAKRNREFAAAWAILKTVAELPLGEALAFSGT